MAIVTDDFARTMRELNGEAGVAWVRSLPDLLAGCARRWSLTILPPFPNLSYNYVAPALRADGTPAVLKVGYPNPELLSEIQSLRVYAGRGIIQLLESDETEGALLLERLEPGVSLARLDDDREATAIAAGVMRDLRQPAPPDHAFITVADWTWGLQNLRPRFDGTTGPLPAYLVEAAETLFAELLPSMAAPVLLHGDLHHDNILSATRRPWLALDPKGILGEPAYEVGTLLRNPMPQLLTWPNPQQIMARRVDQLADALGFDRRRIIGWGLAQAVLSAWWSIEDHGHSWESSIWCAEILSSL